MLLPNHEVREYLVRGRPPVWYQRSPLVWQTTSGTINGFLKETEHFLKVHYRLSSFIRKSSAQSNFQIRRIVQAMLACKPLDGTCLRRSEGRSSCFYSTNRKPLLAASPGIPSPMLTTAPSTASPRWSFLFRPIRTKRSKVAAQIAMDAVTQLTDIATTSKIV